MADVSIHNISKSFKTNAALTALSLDIADGEFVVLLGPTGAGKTTTLRLVAGLETPDEGDIKIDGKSLAGLPPSSRDVAFVFQQFSLYPHLSVYDNIAFPLRSPARRMSEENIKKRIQEVAEVLHIEAKLSNRSTQLSGGEMQRVALGRALVRQPAIYLMDEPLSSLDAKLRAELRIELKRIQRDFSATTLYVTHDQVEALTLANRIGVIDKGKLIQLGSPRDIFENPKSIYVAQRLGQPQINLIPVGLIEAGATPDGAKTIGARTEHLNISKSKNGTATVNWLEHLGDQNRLHIKIGDHNLTSLVAPDSNFESGNRVNIKLVKPLYFDATGARV